MNCRLVVLGGSAVSTVQLIDALADWPGGQARRPDGFELVLHGRSWRLEAVADACRMRAAARALPVSVSGERDLAAALDGADLVLNQIRVGGLQARSVDESFPQEFGIPGEETMGPGGLACAVRTIRVLRPIWAQVARRAPAALVINLTNPAGIVQQAARTGAALSIVTVCDSPLGLLDSVACRLGRPDDEVRSRYVGMNHVGWYVPADFGELDRLSDLADGLDPEVATLHAAMPGPYLRYYTHPDRVLAAQHGAPTRADQLLAIQQETMNSYRQGVLPAIWQRKAPWYGVAVVPLIDAWLNGADRTLVIGLPNAGRVPWLASDVIIEGPVRAPVPGHLEAQPVVALPDLPRGLLARHAAYERLAVQALAGQPTTAGLTRALLANPMVASLDQARALAAAIMRRMTDPA